MVEIVFVSIWCGFGERARRGIVVLGPMGVHWLGTPVCVALWDEEVGGGVQRPGVKFQSFTQLKEN